MTQRKNIQIAYELESWSRSLDYFRQEIVCIKNRLSEVVEGIIHPEFLEKVEYFQNNMINKDIVIEFLRKEIMEQKNNLFNKPGSIELPVFINKHARIRDDMAKMEMKINELKTEFNTWITEQTEA